MRKLITIIASCALLVCQAYASQNNRSTEKRIDAIISGMTLEEKAAQMIQVPYAIVGREEALRTYEMAVKERYRFFSFGDAMFISDK